jgi:ribosomal-protein-alanine N-acetyltransferase
MSKFLQFESDRLIIRPTDFQDARFVLELYNSPKWLKYIGDRKIRTVEEARIFIKDKIHPPLEKNGFSNYTMIRKSDKLKVGVCGLYDREGIEGFDLGFALLPQFEKMGYAFEASKCLLEAAKKQFSLEVIGAITTIDNLSSQQLLKKLDFGFVGMIRLKAESEELMYYRIIL